MEKPGGVMMLSRSEDMSGFMICGRIGQINLRLVLTTYLR